MSVEQPCEGSVLAFLAVMDRVVCCAILSFQIKEWHSMLLQPAAGVDEAHALDSLAGGVFVGRQREMGELKACLEDALSGRGRLVTLVGEPLVPNAHTSRVLVPVPTARELHVGQVYVHGKPLLDVDLVAPAR